MSFLCFTFFISLFDYTKNCVFKERFIKISKSFPYAFTVFAVQRIQKCIFWLNGEKQQYEKKID